MNVDSIEIGTDPQVDQINRAVHLWHKVNQLTPQVNTASCENSTPIAVEQASPLEQAVHIAKSQPELRTARVDELRAQIEAGTYRIDSEAIAQKMLNVSPDYKES